MHFLDVNFLEPNQVFILVNSLPPIILKNNMLYSLIWNNAIKGYMLL